MNIDGGGAEMLTTGEGDVANPAWSPDGQKIAFAWTRGYEIGGFNIFIMDVASRQPIQMTHGGTGSNENPSWAPDGLHIWSSPPSAELDPNLHHAGGRHATCSN